MKKVFIVSDVHSFYNQMIDALNNAGFDKNNCEHIFVSLGDLLDRGPDPLKCLQFVNSLPEDRAIIIKGNHETLLEDCLINKYFTTYDYSNGTADTVMALGNFLFLTSADQMFKFAKNNIEWLNYKKKLRDFYDDGKNVFVHGWIPCYKNDPNTYHARNVKYTFYEDWKNGNWEAARWTNGMDAWNQGVKLEGKTIYCGHWHTSWGNSKLHKKGPEFDNKYSTNPEHRTACFDPFIDDGIVALDACTAVSHKVNCYVVEVPE